MRARTPVESGAAAVSSGLELRNAALELRDALRRDSRGVNPRTGGGRAQAATSAGERAQARRLERAMGLDAADSRHPALRCSCGRNLRRLCCPLAMPQPY